MRKICALLLAISTLSLIFVLPISVFAENAKLSENDTLEDVLFYTCTYNPETEKITISGSVNYDAFAQYQKSTLDIYLVPAGQNEYTVANNKANKPLASVDISVNFEFTFNATNVKQKYSRYAIFIRSSEGEITLGAAPQYPQLVSEFTFQTDKTAFKGISASDGTVPAEIDAGTTVISVYMDKFITNQSEYIYRYEQQQIFFSRPYVDELDKKIHSAYAAGSKIYLRFIYRNQGVFASFDGIEETRIIMPSVYNETVLMYVHSITDFLLERYSDEDNEKISGIVLGYGWDNYTNNNFFGGATFDVYTAICGFYTYVVATAARSVNSDIDIVVPFESASFNPNSKQQSNEFFETDDLLENLLEYFETNLRNALDFSILIETKEVPFGITNENIQNGVDIGYENAESRLCAGNHEAFFEYFGKLDKKYKKAPVACMFLWTPPSDLGTSALTAAYVYSYYALSSQQNISAFVIELSGEAEVNENAEDLYYTLKIIDTTSSNELNEYLLPLFGVDAWEKIRGIEKAASGTKKLYTIEPSFSVPNDCKGYFSYFDFSSILFADRWYGGIGCSSVKIDYSQSNQKALKADMSRFSSDTAELVYDYELQENAEYTPYLKFSFMIEDTSASSLYKVKIFCENSAARYESSAFVVGNEETNIVLGVSKYSGFGKVEDLRFSVTPLDLESDKYTLWVNNITGYSKKYTNEELQNLIAKDRDELQNDDNEAKESIEWQKITLVVIIAVISTLLAVVVIVSAGRANRNYK